MSIGQIVTRGLGNGSLDGSIPGIVTAGFLTGTPVATAPILNSAVLAVDGDSITLNFDQTVTFGAGGNAGFVPTFTGGAATLTYLSGDGTSTLIYTISRTIDTETETGTLAYTQPGDGVEGVVGNEDLVSFAGFTITIPSGGDNTGIIRNPLRNILRTNIVRNILRRSSVLVSTINIVNGVDNVVNGGDNVVL